MNLLPSKEERDKADANLFAVVQANPGKGCTEYAQLAGIDSNECGVILHRLVIRGKLVCKPITMEEMKAQHPDRFAVLRLVDGKNIDDGYSGHRGYYLR